MYPFDLPGPSFLVFYLAVAAGTVVAAAWLRHWLRAPGGESALAPSNLSPYHLAYLAGGKELALTAAVAGLVRAGALEVNAARKTVSIHNPQQAKESLERELHACVANKNGCPLRDLYRRDYEALSHIRAETEQSRLTLPSGQARMARALPLSLMGGVLLLGGIKILVGISLEKPVGLLFVLVGVTAVLAVVGFARQALRSRRGDRLLRRARAEQAALQTTAQSRPNTLSAADLSCAVGLFGVAMLAGSQLADLRTALRVDQGGWNGGGDGGGGGCGGGGCGGGGGGCGGCSG